MTVLVEPESRVRFSTIIKRHYPRDPGRRWGLKVATALALENLYAAGLWSDSHRWRIPETFYWLPTERYVEVLDPMLEPHDRHRPDRWEDSSHVVPMWREIVTQVPGFLEQPIELLKLLSYQSGTARRDFDYVTLPERAKYSAREILIIAGFDDHSIDEVFNDPLAIGTRFERDHLDRRSWYLG